MYVVGYCNKLCYASAISKGGKPIHDYAVFTVYCLLQNQSLS